MRSRSPTSLPSASSMGKATRRPAGLAMASRASRSQPLTLASDSSGSLACAVIPRRLSARATVRAVKSGPSLGSDSTRARRSRASPFSAVTWSNQVPVSTFTARPLESEPGRQGHGPRSSGPERVNLLPQLERTAWASSPPRARMASRRGLLLQTVDIGGPSLRAPVVLDKVPQRGGNSGVLILSPKPLPAPPSSRRGFVYCLAVVLCLASWVLSASFDSSHFSTSLRR